MSDPLVTFHYHPEVRGVRMVLGFSGWMDGGEVSLGTVEHLAAEFDARESAVIRPGPFYLYSFPGSMEIASLFRPHVTIEDGLITEYEGPTNRFLCDEANRLVLFEGREPNLCWERYADCMLDFAADVDVALVCFVGSVAGAVPHTREPRVYSSVSEEGLLPLLQRHGLEPSNYEGPGSFVTYLMTRAQERRLPMLSLVVAIPAYVQGRNPKCIEAAARKLGEILDLPLDLSGLRTAGAEFQTRLDQAVHERPELAELVGEMERDYEKEATERDTAGLKEWFENQDIRLD